MTRPRSLETFAFRAGVAILLISAGRTAEHDFNVLYERAADGRVEHWNLPDLEHTRVLRNRPQEYQRRVAAFFDTALTTPTDNTEEDA